jgi:hypothetical protein
MMEIQNRALSGICIRRTRQRVTDRIYVTRIYMKSTNPGLLLCRSNEEE